MWLGLSLHTVITLLALIGSYSLLGLNPYCGSDGLYQALTL